MTDFNPEKYGFQKGKSEPYYDYETPDFRLSFTVDGEFLTIYDTDDTVISEGKVRANNQSLALLLKAFAIQRPKS